MAFAKRGDEVLGKLQQTLIVISERYRSSLMTSKTLARKKQGDENAKSSKVKCTLMLTCDAARAAPAVRRDDSRSLSENKSRREGNAF